MITISGQLAIKTIHGRNGDFNVARLLISIGEFSVKNPILEQYKEGMYEGDFFISRIAQAPPYFVGSRMILDPPRADIASMTLSGIDALSNEDATRMTPQEPDPIEEDHREAALAAGVVLVTSAPDAIPVAPVDPLVDTTPFGLETSTHSAERAEVEQQQDVQLFGALWPLTPVLKLDTTVNRRVLRQQRDRLDQLGYDFDPLTQRWTLQAA